MRVTIHLRGESGACALKAYKAVPEDRFEELNEAELDVSDPFEVDIGGREVRLMVLRKR